MTQACSAARLLNKSAYFFSVSSEDQKVVHLSSVPKEECTKEFSAKLWMNKVVEVLGGKAGGKDDTSQGVGTDSSKVLEAIEVAKQSYVAPK